VLKRLVLTRGAGCGLGTGMFRGHCVQIAQFLIGDGSPVVQVMVGGIVESRHDDTYARVVEDTAQAHDGHVEGKAPLVDGEEEGRRVQYHVVAYCLHGVYVQIVERLPGGGQALVKHRTNAGTWTIRAPLSTIKCSACETRFMPLEKLGRSNGLMTWVEGQSPRETCSGGESCAFACRTIVDASSCASSTRQCCAERMQPQSSRYILVPPHRP
jgi:hypothetical protein